MARGLFIVFEGIDGAGTTTQAARLTEWLRGRGELVHRTYEPSTGPIGTMIRQILGHRLTAKNLAGEAQPMDPSTVALLFAADRLDHLQNEIEPHLAAGYHVVCDRYVVSSLAYQSVDVDLRFVRQINEKAIDPDFTFYLQVRPELAMDRIDASRAGKDTFENLPFLREVASAYDAIFTEYRGGEVITLDGSLPVQKIFGRVRGRLEREL